MIGQQLKLFALLYYRPYAAFSRIVDQGSWVFGLAMVVLVSFVTPPYAGGFGLMATVLGLAALFVPASILMATLFGGAGGFGVALRRDYGPLLTCALMAWSGSHLFTGLVARTILPGPAAAVILSSLNLLALALFAGGMWCAFSVLFGNSGGRTLLLVIASFGAVLAGTFVLSAFGPLTSFIGFPLFWYFLYRNFSGEVGEIGASFRSRGHFRRQLEMAAINPHDADAHYQLGLIYQQRRQATEAMAEFERAVAIDPDETDAHFQLGRLARQQGRLDEALVHCEMAARQNDKHAFSEVWREIGAIHLEAGRVEQARECLAKFVARREYDPEGLYLLGETLRKGNRDAEAKEMFARTLEAVRTMPAYRRGQMRKWSSLAKGELKKLG
ncbi:MAG: tetratricopeptide repeat protein [Bryobacteraceae bacterium]